MKKMMYSNFTKFIAVVLCIASIVAGAWIATNGLYRYSQEEERVYQFENDFSESAYLAQLLSKPQTVITDAYRKSYGGKDSTYVTKEIIGKNIEEAISNNISRSDKINYYIQWRDKIFTNCGAGTPEELMRGDVYFCVMRFGTRNIWYESKPVSTDWVDVFASYDTISRIVISTNIKEEYLNEYKVLWEQQEAIVVDAFTKALCFILLALLFLIYLICVCGKNKDGELKTMWLDHIWPEVHLAAIFGAVYGIVLLYSFIIDAYQAGHIPNLLTNLVIGGALPLASAVVITSLLSIIRSIKCRRFAETSIILRMAKRCWRVLLKVSKWFYGKLKSFKEAIFYALSKKTGIIFITTLVVYTALIATCCFTALLNPLWSFLSVLVFGFACFVVSYRAKDTDEIKKGVSQVRNGNVAYKIPALKSSDLNLLAEDINDITKGLDESVAARVKAERLKTELITNVSHDLKTPITSIISYTALLSKIQELPEEAKDYVQVISKKGERLKNLTQDLFDISKAQSGNEEVVLEKLDVSLLVQQSLAEYESEIQKSELPFCVDVSKELYILADGRKISRVVSNLINNILKYSLKGTRAFITASEKEDEIVVEFKNIASYPMDFSDDEIVGRFVRGDESRTTEGNGLGLAIVKSYTEICNGKFEVVIDGDLFKAILKFKQYS